jgi:predicted anti-sigma-YlaC factor YlaD
MDCKEIQAELSAYIDRELAQASLESICLHLAVCEQCNAQHEKLLRGWQALDAWEESAPPDRIRRNILDSARPRRKAASLRSVLSVAAVLLLVFGIIIYYAGQKTQEDEIVANLLIFQDNDFFEALDDLVMIDDLPFADDPSNSSPESGRSSLDLIFT